MIVFNNSLLGGAARTEVAHKELPWYQEYPGSSQITGSQIIVFIFQNLDMYYINS